MFKKVIIITLSLCLIFCISMMTAAAADETWQGEGRGELPPMGERPSGEFTPPEGFTPPDGEFMPPRNAGEFTPPQREENSSAETSTPQANTGVTEEQQEVPKNGEGSDQTQDGSQQFGGRMPEGRGGFPGNMQNVNGQMQEEQPKGFTGFVKTYSTPIVSVILLGLAFVFVIFYRRKNF